MRMKASPRHNCNWQHVVAKDIIDPKPVMEKQITSDSQGLFVASEKVGREEEELLTAYSSKMVEQTTRCAIRCMNRTEETP
jgi:hypothetical protein